MILTHSFVDDNTLSNFAKTIVVLISILGSESEIALRWFKVNHMIVNPGKFQATIFHKHKGNHNHNQIISIDQKEIKVVSKIKLLRIEIDGKLNLNHHINNT